MVGRACVLAILCGLFCWSSNAHTRDVRHRSTLDRDGSLRSFDGAQLDLVRYLVRLSAGQGHAGDAPLISNLQNDQGRLYVAFGAPAQVTKFPASTLFCPLEIWHYRELPQLKIYHSVQFLFFKEPATGRYRMFSPSMDTMLKLLQ